LSEVLLVARLVVVVGPALSFISGFLNNIKHKENNSKPLKGHSDKTIYVKNMNKLHNAHAKKTIGK